MYIHEEKNIKKLLMSSKENSKENIFNNFKYLIETINFDINGANENQNKNLNLINYILKSKNELVYNYVMENYKDQIEFTNKNSYYSFMIELLNQKKTKDFLHFFQFEKNFSQYRNEQSLSYQEVLKGVTKREDYNPYDIEDVYNMWIGKSLLLDDPEIYVFLLDNGIVKEQEHNFSFKIKKWFLDKDIVKKSPKFILKNIEYFKNQKDKEVYELAFSLIKEYSNYQSCIADFIVNNLSKKNSTIIKDFKIIIDFSETNSQVDNYFKNNILYNRNGTFNDKEILQIGDILNEYFEDSYKDTRYNFSDYFFRHNYNVAPSINYSDSVPYRFKDLQKLYDIITKDLTFEERQSIPRFFISGIFETKDQTYPTDKRDLLQNLPTIAHILKENSLTLSNPKDLLSLNTVSVDNICEPNSTQFQFLKPNIYSFFDKTAYQKLHEENLKQENGFFSIFRRIDQSHLYTSCFYAANSKSIENSILKIDTDHISILRELAIIKVISTLNDNLNYYPRNLSRIDGKIETFLNKTQILPKKEFDNFIDNFISFLNTTPIEQEKASAFETLFEKINLKNSLKNTNIKNINEEMDTEENNTMSQRKRL